MLKRLIPRRVPWRLFCSSASNDGTKYTHFGFQEVAEQDKSKRVYEVFENVASKYDLMNDVMSFGIHRYWKDRFAERLNPSSSTKLLDVAGGTGDIAFRMLRLIDYKQRKNDADLSQPTDSAGSVTVCDINQAMLDVGEKRARDLGYSDRLTWKCGNAEALPFPDNSFDAFTIAFGIRNCTHVDKVLSEAFRVLRTGGRFMCLEFSRVPDDTLAKIYDLYSFQVIPVMGQIFAGDWRSYQYLVESIRRFPDEVTFADMIQQAGFRAVTYEQMSFGVVAIHSGFKL